VRTITDRGTHQLCTAYFEILNPNPLYIHTDLCVYLTMSKKRIHNVVLQTSHTVSQSRICNMMLAVFSVQLLSLNWSV